MKKILVLVMICLLPVTLSGCGKGKPQDGAASSEGQTKTYNLLGQREVSFTAPGDPWVEKVQTVGEEDADLGRPADTVVSVTFRKGETDGLIAVGALGQQKDEKGKYIELENDQKTLNQIAMWVVKRDGKITEQEYKEVAGTNAYHMVFTIKNGENEEKGEQYHFTKDGFEYTLSILLPLDEFDSQVGQFHRLVETFSVKNSGKPAAATPAAKATPAK